MTAFLWMASAWALVACAAHLRERIVARERVGRVLHIEAGSKLALLVYGGVGVGALATMFFGGAVPGLLVGSLVLLSVAAVVLAHPRVEEVCGTEGVRRGSWSHAYGDLDEWRLTGDHLRFRAGEVWRAVALPAHMHEEVRRRLETLAGGRESRFSK